METSGVLVLALTLPAARSLSQQFKDKVVEKEYVALVKGLTPWEPPMGEITLAIRPDPHDRPRQVRQGGRSW